MRYNSCHLLFMVPMYFSVNAASPLVKSTHLSEGRPLSFRALVHVVVGVCVGVEDPRGAQLVHGVQAHPRRVPEPHRPVLVSSERNASRKSIHFRTQHCHASDLHDSLSYIYSYLNINYIFTISLRPKTEIKCDSSYISALREVHRLEKYKYT